MTPKIFVSHSAADVTLASALIDCLLSSIILKDEDIRCTSVPGHKLPVGSDFVSTLLDDIGESSVVVGLITPQAIKSSWVLFELGATWGAKKNLKPLVTDNVEMKSLPGPIAGRHVARISSREDIAQLVEELTRLTGEEPRSAAKRDNAIAALLDEHCRFLAAAPRSATEQKVQMKSKEPTFAGVPFAELVAMLSHEMIIVPAKHTSGRGDVQQSLFELFVANANNLAGGLKSSVDVETPGGFLYRELAIRLIPYGLAEFEKLPAAEAKWYQRIRLSKEGQKFLLQYKRAVPAAK